MARLWDVDTGQPVGQPTTGTSFVISVAFSPGGRRIVSGSYDKTVRVWDSDNGQAVGQPRSPATQTGCTARRLARTVSTFSVSHRRMCTERRWVAVSHSGWLPTRRTESRLVLGCTITGGPHSIERSHEVRRSLVAAAATVDVLADLMFTPAYRRCHPGPYDTLGDPTMPPYARRRHLVASNEHVAWDALPDIIADTLIPHGTDDQLAPLCERRSAGGAHFAVDAAYVLRGTARLL